MYFFKRNWKLQLHDYKQIFTVYYNDAFILYLIFYPSKQNQPLANCLVLYLSVYLKCLVTLWVGWKQKMLSQLAAKTAWPMCAVDTDPARAWERDTVSYLT